MTAIDPKLPFALAEIGQKQRLGCPLRRQVCLHSESREKIWAFVSLARDEIDQHAKGIYFRSAHLANVILTLGGTLGLIDISDMETFHRPVRQRRRLHKTCSGKAINA